MNILYQGHGSLRLITDAGTIVYVDPCAGEGYDAQADLILVTHMHGDHAMVNKPSKKPDCRIILGPEMTDGKEYRSARVKDIRIEAVPAYNRNHRRSECVGYLVFADGVKCYFSGDTSKIPEMAALSERELDYAFFPSDGFYNMDAAEAAECAGIVGAKHSTPIHTVPYHGSMEELFGEETAERFRPKGRLIIRPGESITA
ncbi:MAG: MBL fold metallo-hydrolase [Clostridiaceae bacterium]|jgi:L-ascorbate metabolism protein UlaG (beta-lactamase superfamily)|nr:MBL fold metallo-hydrolase [Oscillospiraceae bacterium]NLO62882.1 MBL fold metallo-hydrolase [Clostridiaceae bacterium]